MAHAEAELHPAVLAAARRGDPQAFTEVLMHHDRQLRLLAFRLLGDEEQMEDALQDAAIRAFRAIPRFDGRRRSAPGSTASCTRPASII